MPHYVTSSPLFTFGILIQLVSFRMTEALCRLNKHDHRIHAFNYVMPYGHLIIQRRRYISKYELFIRGLHALDLQPHAMMNISYFLINH